MRPLNCNMNRGQKVDHLAKAMVYIRKDLYFVYHFVIYYDIYRDL